MSDFLATVLAKAAVLAIEALVLRLVQVFVSGAPAAATA
jgi:hypothetical protein